MKTLVLLILCMTVIATACNSKYEESSPGSVKYNEGEIAQRAKLSTEMEKMSQRASESINRLVREGHFTESNMSNILPLVGDAIQGQIPELNDDSAIWIFSLDKDEYKLKYQEPDLCLSLIASLIKNSSGPLEVSNAFSYTLHPCTDKKVIRSKLKVKLLSELVDVSYRSFDKIGSYSDIHCSLDKKTTHCDHVFGGE